MANTETHISNEATVMFVDAPNGVVEFIQFTTVDLAKDYISQVDSDFDDEDGEDDERPYAKLVSAVKVRKARDIDVEVACAKMGGVRPIGS